MGGWGSGGNPPSRYPCLETYVPLSLPDLRRGRLAAGRLLPAIIEPGGEGEGLAHLRIQDYWILGAFKFERYLTYSREPFEGELFDREQRLRLGYRYSVPAGFLEVWRHGWKWSRRTRVEFSTTRLASGGARLWLTCPECGTLRDKLFAPWAGPFKCRVCYRLTYRSSLQSGRSKRIQALARRVAAEMGLEAP